jgi:hypothetical protein
VPLLNERHIARFVRGAVKVDVIPDKENKDSPDFSAVVAFALYMVVQKGSEKVGVKELLCRLGQKGLTYNFTVFFIP